jgi:uncharacterized protein YbjT (DUF2867 family)
MRALVTGGTGFIGRQVVRQLLVGNHRVLIFSRGDVNTGMFGDRSVEVVSGDASANPHRCVERNGGPYLIGR